MNEKHAKQLRRQAVQMAAAVVAHGRQVSTERVHQPQSAMNSTTVVNAPTSMRGIYRTIKKRDKQSKK